VIGAPDWRTSSRTATSCSPVRRLAANGLEAWAQVLERGYEGWVGKDAASPYRGGVTRSWLKVKVPGWTDAEDRWKRRLTAR
jgi:ATP-dependent DNA ligase